MIQPERSELQQLIEVFVGFLVLMAIAGFFAVSTGVVSFEKKIEPVVIPTPTATMIPTPRPTPTPEPTPDWTGCGVQDNCFKVREWYSWFRVNADNFGGDLACHFTVYNYKLMPFYHYSSAASWGTRSYFKHSPEKGDQFLFVFLNNYCDGADVRNYGFTRQHFMVQIKDKLYYDDDSLDPTQTIQELDNLWDFAHIESPHWWGIRIVQDLQTGIKTAEPLGQMYTGRGHAWDGFLIFEIPADTNMQEVRLAASFDNVGGNAWWKLV